MTLFPPLTGDIHVQYKQHVNVRTERNISISIIEITWKF